MLHRLFAPILRAVSYRYGVPFILSVVLAVLTVGRVGWRQPTSIWSFALVAFIATTFALLCGGRFRTVYVAIAVVPQFIVVLQWFIQMRSWMPDQPIKPVAEFFLYFVAAPILVVWLVATLLNRRQRHA
jgi:hypothetical protein